MKAHAYWGLTLITAINTVMIMLSDIFLRDGGKHPGTDPFSWDLMGTFLMIVWITATFNLWFGKHRR